MYIKWPTATPLTKAAYWGGTDNPGLPQTLLFSSACCLYFINDQRNVHKSQTQKEVIWTISLFSNIILTWLHWRTVLKTGVLVPSNPTPSVSSIIRLLLLITSSVRWDVLRLETAAPKLSVTPWGKKRYNIKMNAGLFFLQISTEWNKWLEISTFLIIVWGMKPTVSSEWSILPYIPMFQ